MMKNQKTEKRCGYVTIIGRPNVGKSTLLNRILNKKISITSRKPQTTRHRLLGVQTYGRTQTIYVDTPGMHKKAKSELNRYMNKTASGATQEVDLILFMVEALLWQDDDTFALNAIETAQCPVILVVNKLDKAKDKTRLLPYIEDLSKKYNFKEILLISAQSGKGVAPLKKTVDSYLPVSEFLFPRRAVTDRNDYFITTEIIREQLMRHLGDEVPYATTVGIEQFKNEKKMITIHAVIYVEKDSQKAIVIGKDGMALKNMGTKARLRLEEHFGRKIFLQLWVKVKKQWSDNASLLQGLGYD